jgi:hypothetical protein
MAINDITESYSQLAEAFNQTEGEDSRYSAETETADLSDGSQVTFRVLQSASRGVSSLVGTLLGQIRQQPSDVYTEQTKLDMSGQPTYVESILKDGDNLASIAYEPEGKVYEGFNYQQVAQQWSNNHPRLALVVQAVTEVRKRILSGIPVQQDQVNSSAGEDTIALHPSMLNTPAAIGKNMSPEKVAKLEAIRNMNRIRRQQGELDISESTPAQKVGKSVGMTDEKIAKLRAIQAANRAKKEFESTSTPSTPEAEKRAKLEAIRAAKNDSPSVESTAFNSSMSDEKKAKLEAIRAAKKAQNDSNR